MSLRDKLDEAQMALLQRQAEPVLMAMQAAAREVEASVRALEAAQKASRRPTLRQSAALMGAGVLLGVLLLMVLLRPRCGLSANEESQRQLGARLEAVGPDLSELDRARFGAQLRSP